ncbi:MAG: TIM barrel protein [Gammaproteobacteria bacterium]|nr:TIM barrel protein [Gammaproteobacteria bacterium]
MQLQLFKTLWGFVGHFEEAAAQAVAAGFNGLEGQVPKQAEAQQALRAALQAHDLGFIAEITTGGSYVPDRQASMGQHLADLEAGLDRCQGFDPHLVTVIAGCDAWSEQESQDFFMQAMALGARYGVVLCFETHRSRSLFNPWVTQRLLEVLPDMQLTVDFSHWCVVCERLLDTELDVIEAIAPRVRHIHARIGYDQGPQVPHPAAPEYAEALAAHQRWWELCWDAQRNRGFTCTTMTPEFGPDGYLHQLPFTAAPVADLWQINRWVGDRERNHFETFLSRPRS